MLHFGQRLLLLAYYFVAKAGDISNSGQTFTWNRRHCFLQHATLVAMCAFRDPHSCQCTLCSLALFVYTILMPHLVCPHCHAYGQRRLEKFKKVFGLLLACVHMGQRAQRCRHATVMSGTSMSLSKDMGHFGLCCRSQ